MSGDETRQQELGEWSPSWVRQKLTDEATPPEWSDIDRYYVESPFTDTKWIGSNGWRKWHAGRDCGVPTVYICEESTPGCKQREQDKWTLICGRCGAVRWDEVLFVNEKWYSSLFDEGRVGWKFRKRFESLWLKPELVLEAGGTPSTEVVIDLLRRSYYETKAQDRMAPLMPWEEQ